MYSRALGILIIASALATATAYADTSATCTGNFLSPLVVSVKGTLSDIMIDDRCEYIYATNASLNQIEIFSLKSGALQTPIPVGSMPGALDTSADGKTLYVANSGANDISIVDLTTRSELRRVAMAAQVENDFPIHLAAAQNGLVLITTNATGYGRMMQLDPASNTITQRKDAPFNGETSGAAQLEANADHSVIFIGEGNTSGGPVAKYTSQSNAFSKSTGLGVYISGLAVSRAGDFVLVATNFLTQSAGRQSESNRENWAFRPWRRRGDQCRRQRWVYGQ